MVKSRIWAIVPAAGAGKRMQQTIPKQYLPLGKKTVIEHSIQPLLDHPAVETLVVVIAADDDNWNKLTIATDKSVYTVTGGQERFLSVFNGLVFLNDLAMADDWVLVHDAARPCLRVEDLQNLFDDIVKNKTGGILGAAVADTIKQADTDKKIQSTVDRTHLWRALTPQMFRYNELYSALNLLIESGSHVTDEAEAMEKKGFPVRIVEGNGDNIKITRKEDLPIAEAILKTQNRI